MRTLLSVFFGVMLVFGATGNATAEVFEIGWTGSTWLNSTNTSATRSFDLDNGTLGAGDVNAGDVIHSATLEISFYDDDADVAQEVQNFGTTFELADLTIDGVLALDGRFSVTNGFPFAKTPLKKGENP